MQPSCVDLLEHQRVQLQPSLLEAEKTQWQDKTHQPEEAICPSCATCVLRASGTLTMRHCLTRSHRSTPRHLAPGHLSERALVLFRSARRLPHFSSRSSEAFKKLKSMITSFDCGPKSGRKLGSTVNANESLPSTARKSAIRTTLPQQCAKPMRLSTAPFAQ